jgi:hypothetical protein
MLREPHPYEGFYATRIVLRRTVLGFAIAITAIVTAALCLSGTAALAFALAASWKLAL